MRCEVCGRKIHGKPYRVLIEGAKLLVCGECSKHGKIIWEEEPKLKPLTPKPKAALPLTQIQSKKTSANTVVDTNLELVEDFGLKVKQAREKLGLSHEELGKRLNEKVSVLKKIETGKMKPDNALATKLEHALKIKLLVPAAEEKIPKATVPKPASRELTLGDLIQLNKKDKEKEETAERKQS
ncbi:MAG: multiprotein bridging factor aMBF1 [Candidatus Bathyarchaeia archaeon]